MVLDTAEGVVHVAQLDSKPCDDGHRSRSSPARDGDGQGYGLQVGAPPKMTYGSVNVTSMLLPVGASSSGA